MKMGVTKIGLGGVDGQGRTGVVVRVGRLRPIERNDCNGQGDQCPNSHGSNNGCKHVMEANILWRRWKCAV